MERKDLKKLGEAFWEIGKTGAMRVPAAFIATEKMVDSILADNSLQQLVNTATLPGIVGRALAMPDIHYGYGFPIGGVAAFDPDEGIVSPGGVGYDINCGVRLLAADLDVAELKPKLQDLLSALFSTIPCGVGEEGGITVDGGEYDRVLRDGAKWAVSRGHGLQDDLDRIEEGGRMEEADPSAVSDRARSRGRKQLGTLGAGNHFLEVGWVEKVEDARSADAFGLREGQVTLFVHSGSRGFGHQVATDAIASVKQAMPRYNIRVPDPQLCSVPIRSTEGAAYLGAMRAAVNYGFANRQVLSHLVREAVQKTLGLPGHRVRTVYEVAHNIAKFEEHEVGGRRRTLCVHRKGATRSFPAGRPELPEDLRDVGQPVLIPGDMGRYSFVLVGTEKAMKETFGSCCHGAGRVASRTALLKSMRGRDVVRELEEKGVLVKAASRKTLAEEAPEAYKDVADVVGAVEAAGIARVVARLRPLGVIKG